ncbi:MAG: hypothetical protein WCD57_19595 [Acidobacteriaceae bacterium]
MQIEEAREMVNVATKFLTAQDPTAKDIRLEQIEQRDGEFSIVLSYPEQVSVGGVVAYLGTYPRVYKEVVVTRNAKEVMALRIWK